MGERTCNICLFQFGLFHLTWWSLGHPFPCKWHISIHWLMGIWADSVVWLLWIQLLWTWVCRYIYIYLHFFSYMLRSSITGSYGISSFSFLRNHHTNFHSGCTNLYSHQQGPFSSQYPCQHLLSFVFLMITIRTGVSWSLSVIFICVSLWLRMLDISSCIY
jgi:hypothetical protein